MDRADFNRPKTPHTAHDAGLTSSSNSDGVGNGQRPNAIPVVDHSRKLTENKCLEEHSITAVRIRNKRWSTELPLLISDCLHGLPNSRLQKLRVEINGLPLEQQLRRLEELHTFVKNSESSQLDEYSQSKRETCRDLLLFSIASHMNAVTEEQKLHNELGHHKCFDGFDTKELWRLFIDEQRSECSPYYGKYTFENEVGYLAGCFKAFRLALETLRTRDTSAPYTFDQFVELHRVVISGVRDRSGLPLQEGIEHSKCVYQLHLSEEGQRIKGQNMSEKWKNEVFNDSHMKQSQKIIDGVFEVVETLYELPHFRLLHKSNRITIEVPDVSEFNTEEYFCIGHRHRGYKPGYQVTPEAPFKGSEEPELKKEVNAIFEDAFEKLRAESRQENKELIILDCLALLDRMHLFSDGNLRAIVFILGNAMRIENDLDPVIWYDPNRLDGFCSDELLVDVHKGCERFNSYKS